MQSSREGQWLQGGCGDFTKGNPNVVILPNISNTPVASLFPHLPGLLTEEAHPHEDELVSQSAHLSLGPPAAWNSTEDTYHRN